ncbi:MFS transporter [Micromonospora sp. RV43]|uniref:MFS transporter n=1 Tax=Micromonospora sp. RV43 TaxID=1661387 RepID=UPI00069FE556|nr:MFS transporter [Micromonospora sp. RV43]
MFSSEKFGPLTSGPYRLLWISRTASGLGDALMPVTVVFAVIHVGGSAADVGTVLAVSTLVRVGLLLIGGVLADRMPRRLLLLGGDGFLAFLHGAVGLLLLTGHASVGLILAASALFGAASSISKPALTGLVPQLAPRDKLQQANALMGMSANASRMFGPAVAGGLVALSGPAWGYLIDASSFVVSAACLLFLRVPPSTPRERKHFLQELTHGWRELRIRRWYWLTLTGHAVWNFAICPLFVLGPIIFASKQGTALNWGLISTGLAVGAFLGGIVALRWRPRRPLVAGHLALGLTAFELLALIGPMPAMVVAATALIGSAGMTYINEVWDTTVQQVVPEAVISRVSSYEALVSVVIMPLGYAVTGPVAERVGNTPTLLGAAALIVLSTCALVVVPEIRQVRQQRDGLIVCPPSMVPAAGAAPEAAKVAV